MIYSTGLVEIPEGLKNITVTYDEESHTVSLHGMPLPILKRILTQCSLYNSDSDIVARIEECASKRQYDEDITYSAQQGAYVDYLEKRLEAATYGDRQPVKVNVDLPERIAREAEMELKLILELEAHQNDPLPRFPKFRILKRSRAFCRKAVKLVGYGSQYIGQLISGSSFSNADRTESYLRRAAAALIDSADELQKLKDLPETDYEIQVRDVHPTPFESGL